MILTVLRRATRTPAEPDMPPCRRMWGSGCGQAGAHICWTWTAWPHVCRCLRCSDVGRRQIGGQG